MAIETATQLRTKRGPHEPDWRCSGCVDTFADVPTMLTARDIFASVEHVRGFLRFVPRTTRRWTVTRPLTPRELEAGLAIECLPDCGWCAEHPFHAHPYVKGASA